MKRDTKDKLEVLIGGEESARLIAIRLGELYKGESYKDIVEFTVARSKSEARDLEMGRKYDIIVPDHGTHRDHIKLAAKWLKEELDGTSTRDTKDKLEVIIEGEELARVIAMHLGDESYKDIVELTVLKSGEKRGDLPDKREGISQRIYAYDYKCGKYGDPEYKQSEETRIEIAKWVKGTVDGIHRYGLWGHIATQLRTLR